MFIKSIWNKNTWLPFWLGRAQEKWTKNDQKDKSIHAKGDQLTSLFRKKHSSQCVFQHVASAKANVHVHTHTWKTATIITEVSKKMNYNVLFETGF